jgi:hypothetical protein
LFDKLLACMFIFAQAIFQLYGSCNHFRRHLGCKFRPSYKDSFTYVLHLLRHRASVYTDSSKGQHPCPTVLSTDLKCTTTEDLDHCTMHKTDFYKLHQQIKILSYFSKITNPLSNLKVKLHDLRFLKFSYDMVNMEMFLDHNTILLT